MEELFSFSSAIGSVEIFGEREEVELSDARVGDPSKG